MPYSKKTKQETIQRSIRIPEDVHNKIEKLAEEQGRDFAKQVNFMLKKYLEMLE